ncbi:MAG: class I SAM-dependent methyltransferase [Burkholderiales bacterium]
MTAYRRLIEATAARYLPAGRYAYHYARGKLQRDPVYFSLLEHGLIPDQARVLDLGCGQGILLALLATAGAFFHVRNRPDGWPLVPRGLRLRGIEVQPKAVRRARIALGAAASVVRADLSSAEFADSDVIVLLDVLHYLPPAAQETVLTKAGRALLANGVLIIRVADPESGMRTVLTRHGDRLASLLRGEVWGAYHLRPLSQWASLLESMGLQVQSMPMCQGTPFSNVLLVARKP